MTKKRGQLKTLCLKLGAFSRRLVVVIPLLTGVGLGNVAAQIPPPGTVIVNTASSTQQVGATLQTVTSAPVSVTVGGVVSPLPTLSKAFGSASILAGASTPLIFRLTNSAGNPAQSGIAFTDTLPSGLRLTAGATSVVGAGCTATVTFTAPSTIAISGATMLAGTSTCDITISGITNVSAANTDCSANPPAFTNGNASISGLSNAVNGVTNQCLLVTPTLTVTAAPICFRDTPFVDYNATVLGVGAPNGVTITWQKLNGEVVRVLTGQPLSGRLLWPGAALDPSGYPVAWPGWAFVDGEWVSVNDGLRPDMRIVFDVNPTAQSIVSYPAASAACNANPPITGSVPDMLVMKSISAYQGPSPSGPYTVTLRYANAGAENAVKRDVTISDSLPAGMRLVAGSMKLSAAQGNASVLLPNASGTFTFDGSNGRYQTSSNSISVSFDSLAQNVIGLITFDVYIDPGLASESLLKNTADYVYTRSTGYTVMPKKSNTITFKVTGSENITLRGMTLPAVDPGSTVTFENLLTNNTGHTDTFDVTLSASNFPPGTVLKLYKADGTSLLADTDGNGVPDTGPVASGGNYKIVVKAQLPNGVAGGPFSVAKTAKSISNPLVSAADFDVVSAINSLCKMRLEPSNSGRVSPGGSIIYTHVLTNVGNCTETVTFPPGFLDNSTAGWTVQVVMDNPVAGGASTVGAMDSSDVLATTATSFVVPPGGRLVFLARVTAPAGAANGSVNTTTFRIGAGNSGVLAVTDITTVSNGNPGEINDVITGFIDPTFLRPTIWGFIGKPLYLRANAPSCNADPTVIERRTIIITGPNGEREEIIATETGPNTGMFVAEPLNIRLPPVVAGDVILEGRPYDSYEVDLVGCGRKISTTVTLIDPNGVVFDSRTNQPISGATVRIVTASGGVCSSTPASVSTLVAGQVVPAPNVVVTGSDGRFDFPLVAPGDYCVLVVPPNGYTWSSGVPFTQLPAGRNVVATGPTTGGSYGGVFRISQTTGPVILDIPVDAGLIGGLFAQKTVQRSIVEIGEMLDYNVKLKNNTGYALNQSDVLLTDTLPAGFTYVKGSARKDGVAIADPLGGSGPKLVFNLGFMKKDQQISISYRVRVGPGAMQGDGVNRVVGSYRLGNGNTLYSESNVATAKVTVNGGVFTDRAYIVGKVYADCNKDGVQDGRNEQDREVGVPGIRLYLQDGTNAITDAEGKFSFYGLLPRANVLKIDRTTLPAGVSVADLAPISSRHLGKGDSRLVDLKQGELHKANFAIHSCTKEVLDEITSRRKTASSMAKEIDGRLQQKLETDPNLRSSNDVKALPASGSVGLTAPTANVAAPSALGTTGDRPASSAAGSETVRFESIVPANSGDRARPIADKPRREPAIPLETLLPDEDNSLGFIGIKNGDVLAFAQMAVRVKGAAGVTFKLSVNGKDVPEDRVGKRAVLAEKKLQAWEYLGVNLAVGKNVLVLTQIDQFGNARGEKSIEVIAPGNLAKFAIEFPQTVPHGNVADGKTPAKVVIRLLDGNGVAVTSRTAITLSTSAGRWGVEDLSSTEPGIQTFIDDGRAEFELMPPVEPGEALIRVVSGDVAAESKVDFMPDLREFIASGLIEGVLNLRKLDSKGFSPTRSSDGFEQEITHIARSWSGGERDAAARAAMFLKGKVKGEYLLTLAYDSDKNTRERLFRDIQPDEFYPIYGDSSVRGFDAQSTGRFYVRVDKKKSYLLYGDFNTSQYTDARKLANYSRSLTGAKYHFESGNVSANVFASRDTTKQVIDELPANGTSGPFVLARVGGLINSEKVEILTRDRNQPSVIVRASPQTRFVDYELEPLTGRILFKSPVPSLDENLNPISVRITYEIDQGGNQFWVAGGDVQVKLNERFEVGASFVDDSNPMDKFRMAGVNAIARIADKTFLIAELAQAQRELFINSTSQGKLNGNAGRIEFRHNDANVDVNIYAGRAEKDFDNTGSSLGKGRQEMGGRLAYKIDERTRVKGELLQTEDIVGGTKRDGLLIAAERTLENGLRVEAGIRHARETQPQVLPGATAAIPNEVTAARVRVTGDVPGLTDAAAYVEAEVDVKDSARKIAAVGGDYKLPNGGRVYARHEFISSLTGPYGLNNQQRQNSTVVGISADYMKNANIFSEYRIRDAISGGDAEAALGLRNTWTLADGLQLHTGFERVHALSGKGDAESTAATFGLEYTANPLWKGSTRLEFRTSPNSDSILSTVAGAAKISRDWTFLGRNTYSLLKNKGQSSGENEQDRMQLGLAYRQTDNDVWNALGRIEHRTESDTTQAGIELKRTVELVSIHANWQPRRPFTFSGRYAAKWVSEKSNGLPTKSTAHLISGRVIWDIAPRWDVSVAASTLLGKGTQSKHYGLGLELGFMVMENLWVSGGYNIFGYRDDDLTSGEYTNKGVFVRLRYKFDEDLFGATKGSKQTPSQSDKTAGSDQSIKNGGS